MNKKLKTILLGMLVGTSTTALAVDADKLQKVKQEAKPNPPQLEKQLPPEVSPDAKKDIETVLEYQRRVAELNRKIDLLRKQNELLNAKLAYEEARKKALKKMNKGMSELPLVVSIFKVGRTPTANLLFPEKGYQRQLKPGDRIDAKTTIYKIDLNKKQVVVKRGKHKEVLDFATDLTLAKLKEDNRDIPFDKRDMSVVPLPNPIVAAQPGR